MNAFIAEIIGTALIIIFGSGVVANVNLNKSKGQNSGWIVITFGWAIGVFAGVFVSAPYSGAHLNPAVTIALAMAGKFSPSLIFPYIVAQIIGAMIGALLAWLAYQDHFDATDDKEIKLAVFATIPAIRCYWKNFMTEAIATAVFVLAVLYIAEPETGLGALSALPVALLVLGIGLSLGGPTGYAINPARDLGPRIMHCILPIKGKGSSDWAYSWVPVLGPIAGGAIAAGIFLLLA